MDKKAIELKLNQIIRATDNILSVGVDATVQNSAQLQGIVRAARDVWKLVNVPEKKEEVKGDG